MDVESVEKLEKVANHYSQCTGVNCVFVQDLDKHFCPLSFLGLVDCLDCHRKAIVHSEEFGGSYVYFCPKDLMFWSSPVMQNGRIIGAFIAGPVISIDPDEIDIPGFDSTKFKTVTPGLAYSLSRLLFMCSASVLSEFNQQIKINEMSMSFLSGLNESIQDVKENKVNSGIKWNLQALNTALKEGNEKLSKKRLSECASVFLSSFGQTLENIRSWAGIIVNSMMDGAFEGQADENQACLEAMGTIKAISASNDPSEIMLAMDNCRKNLCKMIVKTITDKGFNPVILKALHYIQNNLSSPISESDVAMFVQLSVSHFSRLFNAEVKMSFSKYINKLRIERAKELLIASNLSIIDICEATGYEDQSYFTRIFKQYQGMSPNVFRMKTVKYPNQDYEIHS